MARQRTWCLEMALLAVSGCSAGGNSRAGDTGAPAGGSPFSLPDAGRCYDGSPPAAASGGNDPLCTSGLSSVSFTRDVTPILAQCTGEVCHAPWTYQTLVGQHSRACCDHRFLVEPGQPSASHVIQAVRGSGACVSQMPLDEGSLAPNDIATLIAWVCEGAPED